MLKDFGYMFLATNWVFSMYDLLVIIERKREWREIDGPPQLDQPT